MTTPEQKPIEEFIKAADDLINARKNESLSHLKLIKQHEETIEQLQKKLEELEIQLDTIKDSPYCHICGSCGEAGCCNPKHCLYPDLKAKEFEQELLLEKSKSQRLLEALETAQKHCLCTRNTPGFDYHEEHKKLGMPKSGARWWTPSDVVKQAISEYKEGEK